MEDKLKTTTDNKAFPYKAEELSAFACTYDVFVISLKAGAIVRHIPNDPVGFRSWLAANNIRDISQTK